MSESGHRLKVSLATPGRFHSFDLAAELDTHGNLVEVFTGYPRINFKNTAVPPMKIRPAPWIATPLELANRRGLMTPWLYERVRRMAFSSVDRFAARHLGAVHVYSAHSGVGLRSGRVARARGAVHICHRGSTHITVQDRILTEEYERQGIRYRPIYALDIETELAEYEEADAITVPSTFNVRSFVEQGVPADKIHQISYGVDLTRFRPTQRRESAFTVIFVGALSVRKGIGYLLEGFQRASISGARLVLIGANQPETEALLNKIPIDGVERTGPLHQDRVIDWMSRAHALVLPSLEEGLSQVMPQAMACGCPVIATTSTGAEDLYEDGVEGFIVPIRDPMAIADRLTRLADDPALWASMSEAAIARTEKIGGWADYGRRARALFVDLARRKGHDVFAD